MLERGTMGAAKQCKMGLKCFIEAKGNWPPSATLTGSGVASTFVHFAYFTLGTFGKEQGLETD